MSFLNITDPKKRDSIVADYLATIKILDINERSKELVRQDVLNRMFEPVVESTGKSTQVIAKELVPIREEMKTLNGRLALDTTGKIKDMKQQSQQQQPADDDHTPNVFDRYLLKYGGSRVLDKYFAIQRVGDNM